MRAIDKNRILSKFIKNVYARRLPNEIVVTGTDISEQNAIFGVQNLSAGQIDERQKSKNCDFGQSEGGGEVLPVDLTY